LGYKSESFSESIKNFEQAGLQATVSLEQSPLGTGGAIRQAKNFLPANAPVLIANADTYFHGSLDQLFLLEPKDLGSVGLFQVPDISRFGSVNFTGNQVKSFQEKSGHGPGFVSSGLVVLTPRALQELPAAEAFSFEKDFLHPQAQRFNAAPLEGTFFDIGLPSSYAEFNALKVFETLSNEQKRELKRALQEKTNEPQAENKNLEQLNLSQSLSWIQPSLEHLTKEFLDSL
jgi:NDP-sugar pyrophosphorylase family protein